MPKEQMRRAASVETSPPSTARTGRPAAAVRWRGACQRQHEHDHGRGSQSPNRQALRVVLTIDDCSRGEVKVRW
jgi:hypothetical protein